LIINPFQQQLLSAKSLPSLGVLFWLTTHFSPASKLELSEPKAKREKCCLKE
jgi:hypothetical protein